MTARKLHVKPGNVIVILYSLINKYQLASIGFHQELGIQANISHLLRGIKIVM